jgi:hypothetical protein
MATTSTDIANLALLEAGTDTVTLITDSNERARACNSFYDQARKEVLEMTHPNWNCAKKRIHITADNTAPPFDYDAKFRIPDDCLRVIYPTNTNGQPYRGDWEVRGNYLLMNESDCYLLYIKDLEDVKEMSTLLVQGISLQLAWHIVPRLKQSTTRRDVIKKDLLQTLVLAEGVEGSQKNASDPNATRKNLKKMWVDEQ